MEKHEASRKGEMCQATVTGKISTTCKARNKKRISRVIFDETCYDPANLSPTGMRWISWLAVPAYSRSLKIEVDLEVDGEKIGSGQVLDFEVKDMSYKGIVKEIFGQDWCILVSVYWTHAHSFLDKECHDQFARKHASVEVWKRVKVI